MILEAAPASRAVQGSAKSVSAALRMAGRSGFPDPVSGSSEVQITQCGRSNRPKACRIREKSKALRSAGAPSRTSTTSSPKSRLFLALTANLPEMKGLSLASTSSIWIFTAPVLMTLSKRPMRLNVPSGLNRARSCVMSVWAATAGASI